MAPTATSRRRWWTRTDQLPHLPFARHVGRLPMLFQSAVAGVRWHGALLVSQPRRLCRLRASSYLGNRRRQTSEVGPAKDVGWQLGVVLKLAPHPDLEDGNHQAFQLDLGMVNGTIEITARACMANYFMPQMGLDRDLSEMLFKRSDSSSYWSTARKSRRQENETVACEPAGDDVT